MQQLGLPEDVILGLPRIVLRGNTSLILENHSGVMEYSGEKICLRTSIGAIEIDGNDMTLERLGTHDLMLHGEIYAVLFGKKG
jgi:sporulation protein YqfC